MIESPRTEEPAFRFARQCDISLPLVFIDGITRCGKSALSKVVPSLTRMEHIQFAEELELIVSGLSLGGLRKDYAAAFLRSHLNQKSYNLHISRNVNFRPGDQTAVINYRNPEIYQERLTLEEGPENVERCRASDHYLPMQTHDLMANISLIQDLEINFRILSLWRNPVENIYSWWSRGWGVRFNNRDSTNFSLLIEDAEGNAYPWYVAGYHRQTLGMNAPEKCIAVACDMIERCIAGYRLKAEKDRTLLLFFEDICIDPDREVGRICDFLNVEKTEFTAPALRDARLPREIIQADLDMKIAAFREAVRPDIFDRLMQFQHAYLDTRYGLA
ncbi:Sulfotransferase domain-containing protein [Ectothiorhodosinus mongolicus]|uniref:Sulfotransferase domain-containing protein n=1 Tax=Ectothiorhodosinus mongolicus TaxID=233100 RepID=A0A1R3VTX9_9GAMM|nr:sulfotransferase domain-containing protein [Ectothiorhodosinus mongolicus]ULX56792.1 hypothetical protein CKX93_03155 [Ectothiorhodosinus mongolicus]SIT68339.1 Sulfotransferase domain-containing protein [Ectothiorhodosinus mongolicus]